MEPAHSRHGVSSPVPSAAAAVLASTPHCVHFQSVTGAHTGPGGEGGVGGRGGGLGGTGEGGLGEGGAGAGGLGDGG